MTQEAQSTPAAASEGVTLTILEGSSIQGTPDYDPDGTNSQERR